MSAPMWQQLQTDLANPADYCVSNTEKARRLKEVLKKVFEHASSTSSKNIGPLTTLLVDNVDEETLWEQLQTRNNPLMRIVNKYLKFWSKKDNIQLLLLADGEEGSVTSNDSVDDEDDESIVDNGDDDEIDGEDDEDGEEMEEGDSSNDEDDADSEEDSVDSDEVSEEEEIEGKDFSNEDNGMTSDQEFEMEAWLDATEDLDEQHREKLENREKRAKANTLDQWDDEDDVDDDLDFVEKAMYASDDEDDIDPATLRYEDFFVDDRKKGDAKSKGKRKAVQIDESSGEEDEDEDEDDDDFADDFEDDYQQSDEEDERIGFRGNNKTSKNAVQKKEVKKAPTFVTSYQRRLQELSSQIKELEEELLAEKSWEMKGEVNASHRPENSLLDLAVDVERAAKVAPVVTQEFTTSLEDLIIKRIEDQRFDDPRPRNAAAEVLTAHAGDDNNPVELSQEKSKLGLAEIYAEEYAQKVLNAEDTLSVQTQALREEVVSLFGAVSRHLDALSHFYFTPRPVAAEASAKVLATQRSLPALEMEDISPFNVNSSATKLAPEEMQEKKRGPRIMLMAAEELGRDDRQKLRRVKKQQRRDRKRAAEAGLDENVKRARREEKEVARDRRVSVQGGGEGPVGKKSTGTSGEFSKSSTFFSRLQEDVEATVRGHSQNKAKGDQLVSKVSSSSSRVKL